MNRLFRLVFVLVLGLHAFPVSAQSPTDQFTITNYDVQMTLGRDDDNRSTLKTVETITAEFPETDQNRGIERSFVKEYDDHPTSFDLESVTDKNGTKQPHHWNGNTLRIGEADVFVHGKKTYVLTYTQRDVTRLYQDSGNLEFYWDAIGDEWRVPITQASVRLNIDPSLRSEIRTSLQCYQGQRQSRDRCEVSGDPGEYDVASTGLGQYRGLTVALGFTPGTFAEYQPTWWEQAIVWAIGIFVVLLVTVSPLALLIGGIWLWLKYRYFRRKDPAVSTILDRPTAPEYLPPKKASVTESAVVLRGKLRGRAVSAQLIDWAVRKYVVLEQTKEKKWWSGPAEYRVEVIKDFSSLSQVEREFAKRIFDHDPVVGSTLTSATLKKRARKLQIGMEAQAKSVKRSGLYRKDPDAARWFRRFGTIALVLGVILLINPGLIIVGIIAKVLATVRYLSTSGAELKTYLEGLEYYIGVGEKERLAMLQSPDTAEKVKFDGAVASERLKLYEKTLPYAVLFGQEQQWTKALADMYEHEETTPYWQRSDGVVALNAASLSSMVTGFSSSVAQASNYSSSSSSTGGSSGGGFSGGGGGGGGGGGW